LAFTRIVAAVLPIYISIKAAGGAYTDRDRSNNCFR